MTNIELVEVINFPTLWGDFDLLTYKILNTKKTKGMQFILAIRSKKIPQTPVIRIHSSCIFSEVFSSKLCDCREQLEQSLHIINKSGGILFYLDQEGRGHGIFDKTKELKLQEKGFNTANASIELGLEVDVRTYSEVGQILKDMKIKRIKLLTNNPQKIKSMEKEGIEVTRIALEIEPTEYTTQYLKAKKHTMNHLLETFVD